MAVKSSVRRSRSSFVTQALFLEEDSGRAPRFHSLPDLGPDLVKIGEVADDVFLGASAGRGADDDTAGEPVLVAELADDGAEAGAFLAGFDLARHADVVHCRHEDQEAPGHRDVRGEAAPPWCRAAP
jgi:hypothetical protein